jgi:hypothetical protein
MGETFQRNLSQASYAKLADNEGPDREPEKTGNHNDVEQAIELPNVVVRFGIMIISHGSSP